MEKDSLYSDELKQYSEYLAHYGRSKMDGAEVGSGRYPLGSGDDPYQHALDFEARFDALAKQGFSQKEIAEAMGIFKTLPDGTKVPYINGLRAQKTQCVAIRREYQLAQIHSYQEQGMSLTEIAKKMNFKSESTVRSMLQMEQNGKMDQAKRTADYIRDQIEQKGIIDVGKDVNRELNVSATKFNDAIYLLEQEGYPVYTAYVPQVTNPNQNTTIKVICPKGTSKKEIFNLDDIHTLTDYISYDDGDTWHKAFEFPNSLDSKRLTVRYAEEGGIAQDGLIELRRGVKDISLGDNNYSQVRIMVDGTHYLKGMAVYADDLPDGVDVRFNTNKPKGTPVCGDKGNTVLKLVKRDKEGNVDQNNPFGSLIKEHGGQMYYDDPDGEFLNPVTGKRQSLSLINKRAEEGDWAEWSDRLPAQFLSKQNKSLIKKQLNLTVKDRERELEEIESITNPTLKKKFLQEFADGCDNTAVHLNAASLPRQKYQVILPLTTIGDNEIYAPNYKDGEQVALVRFPHGSTSEIPILTVNNRNKEGINMMSKTPADAVGINKKVADRLSGADFDGDTVMVIPTNEHTKITSKEQLKGLVGFDPGMYAMPEGKKVKIKTQNEMGVISNLITDMTIKGATDDELARAIRHSMVVIDAEKHNYDYRKSEADNKIDELKRIYQQNPDNQKGYGGASTLISRAKSKIRVDKRQGNAIINEDGSLTYKTADDLYYEKKVKNPETGKYEVRYKKDKTTGEMVPDIRKHEVEITKMEFTNDAKTLISEYNTVVENLYADYANSMKGLANRARASMIKTGNMQYNPDARKEYKKEYDHVMAELNEAEKNRPKERKAQYLANSKYKAIEKQYNDLTKAEKKKIRQQSITEARLKVGAKRKEITLSDREWEAIQKGAFTESNLNKIFLYTNNDKLREKATPKRYTTLSETKINKARMLANTGNYSTTEIAEMMGVSSSTIRKYIGDKEHDNV